MALEDHARTSGGQPGGAPCRTGRTSHLDRDLRSRPGESLAEHTVEDIDATYGKLVGEGVRFHSPVRQFPGGIRAAYGRDPDGNVFELLQMPQRG